MIKDIRIYGYENGVLKKLYGKFHKSASLDEAHKKIKFCRIKKIEHYKQYVIVEYTAMYTSHIIEIL